MAVMHAATVDVKKEDAAMAKSGTKRDQVNLRVCFCLQNHPGVSAWLSVTQNSR